MLNILTQMRKSKVLIFNAGSSTLKYQLFDAETETPLFKALIDAIGKKHCSLTVTAHEQTVNKSLFVENHEEAVELAMKSLLSFQVVKSLDEIDIVGHRVVHGGEHLVKPTLITDEVIADIHKLAEIAPLHNPLNLAAIKACRKMCPQKKQVAMFDTAFHATISKIAFLYGLPLELYQKFQIRKYGFHGISHSYVSKRAVELLNKEHSNIITCHLGSGSSLCAIKDGKSVDTSMGFSPLDGLMMGTRSGELDPEIVLFLLRKHYSPEQLEFLLNKRSGLLGITGMSDMREVRQAMMEGSPLAQLAMDMMSYRLSMFIAGYAGVLGGAHAVVFTGGIGENAWYIREKACEPLRFLGIKLDPARNQKNELEISAPDSLIKVYVIPTNEELEMLREILMMHV